MRFFAFVATIVIGAFSAAKAEIQYQMIEGYGGVPLNVMTTGNPENPPILFIHGMAQASNVFRLQFESDLADDFYLVAFDMRGHGLSGKPWQPEMLQPSQPWAGDVAAVMRAMKRRGASHATTVGRVVRVERPGVDKEGARIAASA